MEEKESKKKTIEVDIKTGLLIGIFAIGYIVGISNAKKGINDAYNRGSMDMLNNIISKSVK